jgi:hypothetical protein
MTADSPDNPTLVRLQDQIAWYSRQARRSRFCYKWLKGGTMIAALLVAPVSAFAIGSRIAAGLGLAIAIAETLQQLNQYHEHWIEYRATSEALKHEKFLYLALAGPYATAEKPLALLAERLESQISQEGGKWYSSQQQQVKTTGPARV